MIGEKVSNGGAYVGMVKSLDFKENTAISNCKPKDTLTKISISHLTHDFGDNIWVLDSGATRHVSGNFSLFSNLRKAGNHMIVTAIGETCQVKAIGDVKISIQKNTLILTDVLYVSELSIILLSTPRFSQKGISVCFISNEPATIQYGKHII